MIKRGELYYADLSPVVGSEQGGVRPVLVVQNDGEQIQPHRNRGGSDKQTYEGEIADAYRTRRVPLRTEQKLGRSARTNPDARQAQAERTHRRTAFRHYAESGRCAAYKPRVCREKRR